MARCAVSSFTGRPLWGKVGRCCCGAPACGCLYPSPPGCFNTAPGGNVIVPWYTGHVIWRNGVPEVIRPVAAAANCCTPGNTIIHFALSIRSYNAAGVLYQLVTVSTVSGGSPVLVLKETRQYDPVTGELLRVIPATQLYEHNCLPNLYNASLEAQALGLPPIIAQQDGWINVDIDATTDSLRSHSVVTGIQPGSLTIVDAEVQLIRDTRCTGEQCIACCTSDGCSLVSRAACLIMGGSPQATANCALCPPPTTGACCLPDGGCEKLTERACRLRQGVWLGNGVPCVNGGCPPAPRRACCIPVAGCTSLICQLKTQAECALANGSWGPPGSTCDNFDCTGANEVACCVQSGAGALCVMRTPACCLAIGGTPRGAGTNCNDPNAACLGACCTNIPCPNGSRLCLSGIGEAFCTSPQGYAGQWLGPGTVCSGDCSETRCSTGMIQQRERIKIATGSEVLAYGSGRGCTGCGVAAAGIVPWT